MTFGRRSTGVAIKINHVTPGRTAHRTSLVGSGDGAGVAVGCLHANSRSVAALAVGVRLVLRARLLYGPIPQPPCGLHGLHDPIPVRAFRYSILCPRPSLALPGRPGLWAMESLRAAAAARPWHLNYPRRQLLSSTAPSRLDATSMLCTTIYDSAKHVCIAA